MAMNHFQKLFCGDLSTVTYMYLRDWKDISDKMAKLLEEHQDCASHEASTYVLYKIQEYLDRTNRIRRDMEDSLIRFLGAMRGEDDREERTAKREGCTSCHPFSCKDCKECCSAVFESENGTTTEYFCLFGHNPEDRAFLEQELYSLDVITPSTELSDRFKTLTGISTYEKWRTCDKHTTSSDCCSSFEKKKE